MALWSAASVAFAILVCCAFWIFSGWSDGASAPMMAAVACCFFATQDDPGPGIRSFAVWSVVAVAVVAAYLFAIVPAISHVEMLIVALAPYFLLVGVLIARPQTAMVGMILGANGATLMALQATYNADFESYANSSLAFILGAIAALVITRLVRTVRAEWIAQRLVRTNWETLALTAERRGGNDRAVFVGLMLDRLGPVGATSHRHSRGRSSRRRQPEPVACRPQHHRFAPRAPRHVSAGDWLHRYNAGQARFGLPFSANQRDDVGRAFTCHRCRVD